MAKSEIIINPIKFFPNNLRYSIKNCTFAAFWLKKTEKFRNNSLHFQKLDVTLQPGLCFEVNLLIIKNKELRF